MLDHGGTAKEIVIEIDGNDQRLLIGPADRNRHGVDQRAVDQSAAIALHRFENSRQRIR